MKVFGKSKGVALDLSNNINDVIKLFLLRNVKN
ncbi:hypothetical protein ACV242_001343 [Peribacillus simplex]